MNKILIIGRLTKDPDTNETNSGIKYTRFTLAVNRQFAEDQTDFIPVVAWRSQAQFMENYIKKGALISVEGRFTSSSYQDSTGQNVIRYEITADRVEALETRKQVEQRNAGKNIVQSTTATQVIEFEKENKPAEDNEEKEVPWELDL